MERHAVSARHEHLHLCSGHFYRRMYYGAAKIDDFDLLIGAIAKQSSLILVMHNTRHFSHIPELMIEDWLS